MNEVANNGSFIRDLEKMNDYEKWQCLITNNDWVGYCVNLDNDYTFITFDGCEDVVSFDDYIGWSDGVQKLLETIGVNYEPV